MKGAASTWHLVGIQCLLLSEYVKLSTYLRLPWVVCAVLGSLCSFHWHLENMTTVSRFWKAPLAPSNPSSYCLEAKKSGFAFPPRSGQRAFRLHSGGHFSNVPLLSLHTAWPSLSSEVSPRHRAQILPHRFHCVTLEKKLDFAEPPWKTRRINPM